MSDFPHGDLESGLSEDEFADLIFLDALIAPLIGSSIVGKRAKIRDETLNSLNILLHRSNINSKTSEYIRSLIDDYGE